MPVSTEPFTPDAPTAGGDPLLLYFTSGTTVPAQAGGAHPPQLPGRAPVDDVLDRPAAGRRAPQRLLAGLGQARLVVLLRAVERRRHRGAVQLRPLRRRPAAGRAARRRGDHLLRAADGLADAGAAGPDPLAAAAARAGRGRRAAEPRGDRAGAAGLGDDHPGRLRPDRDHRPDRQPARRAGQAGLDGPAAARLPGGAGRPGDRRSAVAAPAATTRRGHRRRARRGRDLPGPGRAAGRR